MKLTKEVLDKLIADCASGNLVVKFNGGVEATELCADPNQKARVLAIVRVQTDVPADDYYDFTFSYVEFDRENDSFARRNYYDSNHQPVLTAKEAGCWKPEEKWSFAIGNKLIFDVVEELVVEPNVLVTHIVGGNLHDLRDFCNENGLVDNLIGWERNGANTIAMFRVPPSQRDSIIKP